mgnify:CR=1 FL=1
MIPEHHRRTIAREAPQVVEASIPFVEDQGHLVGLRLYIGRGELDLEVAQQSGRRSHNRSARTQEKRLSNKKDLRSE